MSAACRVASAPDSLRGRLDSKASVDAPLLRCGRLAVRVLASSRTRSRPSSAWSAKRVGTSFRHSMATSSAHSSVPSSPASVALATHSCQPLTAWDLTGSPIGPSHGLTRPVHEHDRENGAARLPARKHGPPSPCHRTTPDIGKAQCYTDKPMAPESVIGEAEGNCSSRGRIAGGGYVEPQAVHLPTLLVGGSTGSLPETPQQPGLPFPRECPSATSKATACDPLSTWSPSNLHFMVLPLDSHACAETEDTAASDPVRVAWETLPVHKEGSLLGTPTQPQCAEASRANKDTK